MDELLTSQQAAVLLRVSASSVKRWAEEGQLACAKTAGHHRRFERIEIERFRRAQAGVATPVLDDVEEWLALLLGTEEPHAIEAHLLAARARLESWWRVADSLGPVLEELGKRWQTGRVSVLEEHLASERLGRALSRVCEWLPVASRAPSALLASAEGEDHTLGLSLVEITLREAGWRTLWSGRRTPTEELRRRVASGQPPVRLLAVSASAASRDARALASQAKKLGEACRGANVALLLGGAGRWPEVLRHGTRLHSIDALARWVRPPA